MRRGKSNFRFSVLTNSLTTLEESLALVINFEEIDSCGGHYYSTTTLKAKLLNLIAKGKIARETQATLNAAKAKIEATCSAE